MVSSASNGCQPACEHRRLILGELTKLRKLPIAETQYRKGRPGLRPFLARRARNCEAEAGASPSPWVAVRMNTRSRAAVCSPAVHGRGVHACVRPACKAVVQGLGKAPGAVAFAADQNHGVGRLRAAVVADFRAGLAAAPPQQNPCNAHQRHAQGANARATGPATRSPRRYATGKSTRRALRIESWA